ncbi:relaxase/mobilization nuclease domain-containing protein [Levilactobacillus brevis]
MRKACRLLTRCFNIFLCSSIDGEHHILHNHIIVSKVNLETGKKMQDTQGHSVDSIRNVNDEIAKEQGWQVIAPRS